MSTGQPARPGLAAEVEALTWYHTIDLGGGVVTAGLFDTRSAVSRVPMPASLAGRRCLDVGTWDGFWAFEMERRGAESVVAIDIDDQVRWDWPPRARISKTPPGQRVVEAVKAKARPFELAREALGSRVERVDLSVYQLDPEALGSFDFVFLGSLLLHLRDPVAALDRMRSVCAGEAVIADTVELIPSLLRPRTPTARLEGLSRPWWWQPNVAALRRMVESAGFEVLESTRVYPLPLGPGRAPSSPLRQLPGLLRTPAGREGVVARLWGVPHAAFRARPLTS